MSLREFENKPDRRAERYGRMRSAMDIGMGLIYVVVGLVIFFAKQLNFDNENLTSTPVRLFGGVAIIYGAWRIYRGIKKNYFKK